MPTVRISIDREATVAPHGSGIRKMLGMVRHPDGAIYVNTQTQGLLLKSTDNAETWTALPVNLPGAPPEQKVDGLGVTRDGCLWLLHQSGEGPGKWKDLFVSRSDDGALTWKTVPIDFGRFAPTAPQQPYTRSYNDYNTFAELPDGTLMCAAGLRYEESYYEDPARLIDGLRRPDVHVGGEVMFRTTDGGETWGDPTLVHGSVAEVGYAVDPKNADRILAMARIQRMLLAGEDRAAAEAKTGCDPGAEYVYKNGLLLESNDGGRSFHEAPGGLNEYYGHRGTILWTDRDVVIVTHQLRDGSLLARISLDGGRTWADGTKAGTPFMNESERFELLPKEPGHSFTAPTIDLSPNHFMTAYACWHEESESTGVNGIFWHIETPARRQERHANAQDQN